LRKEESTAYFMITPAVIALIFIVGYPFIMAIYLSMTDAEAGKLESFIGLYNFVQLARSPLFQTAFKNSLLYTFVTVAVKLPLGLILALILNKDLKAKKFLRGIILLPWITPITISAIGWKWMYDSMYGVINWMLINLGLIDHGILWLGKPWLAKVSVMIVNIWRGTPFFAIIILAGLMTISEDVYDAAKVDGAGTLAKFWYITLPLLKPVISFVVLFSTVMTISDYPIVFILTRGGPLNSTHLFSTLAFQIGLSTGYLGRGAAISLFIFPFLLLVVYFQLNLMRGKRWEY